MHIFHAEQINKCKSWVESLIYVTFFFRQSKYIQLRFWVSQKIFSKNITHVFYTYIFNFRWKKCYIINFYFDILLEKNLPTSRAHSHCALRSQVWARLRRAIRSSRSVILDRRAARSGIFERRASRSVLSGPRASRSVLCSSHTFKFISYNLILKLKPT